MTKESIIEKYWPKPSQSDSVRVMKEAIGKMMDEWSANQSILFLEYHRRFRHEEGVAFKKECDKMGGIFSLADVGVGKIYQKFFNDDPIKSESMPGVEYKPPFMKPTIDGNPL